MSQQCLTILQLWLTDLIMFQQSYNYGRQMLETGLMLRRSLHSDLQPNYELSRRLQNAWNQFNRGVKEHFSRSFAVAQFHKRADQVIFLYCSLLS